MNKFTIFLTCLFATLLFVTTCKTSSGDAGDTRYDTARTDHGFIDRPLPEETIALTKITPDKLNDVGLEFGTSRLVSKLPAGTFIRRIDGIRFSEPVWIALSVRGDRDLLRGVNLYAPGFGSDNLPMGVSIRVFLPVDAPEQVKSQLIEECREITYGDECDRIRRIVQYDPNELLIDYHRPLTAETKFRNWSAKNHQWMHRKTPAAETFLESDAALAVYTRSEDIFEGVTAHRFRDFFDALSSSDPTHQRGLFLKTISHSARILEMRTPGSREFEDHCLEIDASDGGVVSSTLTQTRTTQGAAIANAAKTDVQLPPSPTSSADFEWNWSADIASALTTARVPQWDHLWHDPAKKEPPYAWPLATASYPTAFLKGLSSLLPDDRTFTMQSRLISNLLATRGHLEYAPRARSRKIPWIGTASFAVPTDSPGDEVLQSFTQQLEDQFGEEFSHSKSTRRDHTIWKLGFGSSSPPEASLTEVDRGLEINIKPSAFFNSKYARLLSTVARIDRQLLLEFGQWTLITDDTESARTVKISTAESPDISAPSAEIDLVDPTAPPDCMIDARRTSSDFLSEHMPFDDALSREAIADFDLKTAEQSCEDAGFEAEAARIKHARRRWQRFFGFLAWYDGLYRSAEQFFSKACELDTDSSCDLARRVEKLTLQLPVVSKDPSGSGTATAQSQNDPTPPLFITNRGMFVPGGAKLFSTDLQVQSISTDKLLGLDARQEQKKFMSRHSEMLPFQRGHLPETRSLTVVPVSAHRKLPSTVIEHLVKTFRAQPIDKDTYETFNAEKRLLQNTGESIVHRTIGAVVLNVRHSTAQQKVQDRIILRTASPSDLEQHSSVTLTVSDRGISVDGLGNNIRRLDDCSESQNAPEFCLGDKRQRALNALHGNQSGPTGEPSKTAKDPADIDWLATAYHLEDLSHALSSVPKDAPVVIQLNHKVPYGLLARLIYASGPRPVFLK